MLQLVNNSFINGFSKLKLSPQLFGMALVSQKQKTPCVQCIRCYRARKPFWLGKAKSKMFVVHVRPEVEKDEGDELSRLYYIYRTNMKSLRQYFKDQLLAQTTAPEVIEERKQKEAEQHAQCVEENNLWNLEVAKLREERLAKAAIKREEWILEKIMNHEKMQTELIQKIDDHVRREKEASKSFITPKNIDEAIEIAMASVVDHNFCVDVAGNIFVGRYGKPAAQDKRRPTPPTSSDQEKTVSLEARN